MIELLAHALRVWADLLAPRIDDPWGLGVAQPAGSRCSSCGIGRDRAQHHIRVGLRLCLDPDRRAA